jgi:UDP-N-acetyl-2-amino-2-deoxyglucuronate dehydrogenase
MSNFALIGAAGYVAPRHLRAIRDTGHSLLAAFDPRDSVGVLDSYFPETAFFTEFERFDRHLEKLKRAGNEVSYVSICSPNYLHDAHIRFGLRHGAHVICEKPLVLNPWNAEALRANEMESGKKVFTILQLRLHPAIIDLKNNIERSFSGKKHQVDLSYITSRGNWYYASWKGDLQKSGGIATNIGIHFFDMLTWIFGPVASNAVHLHAHDRAAGLLSLEKAEVRWFLSINPATLPPQAAGKKTFREITVDGSAIEFSEGFTDLHTLSYQHILEGNGFGLNDALPAIQLAHDIRNAPTQAFGEEAHPLAKLPLEKHPFGAKR